MGRASRGKRAKEQVFRACLLLCLSVAVFALGALLLSVVMDGRARLDDGLWRRFPSPRPLLAGARSAVFGTLWVVTLTGLLTVQIGVAAAV